MFTYVQRKRLVTQLVLVTFFILVLLYIAQIHLRKETIELTISAELGDTIQCYHQKGPSLPDIEGASPEPGRSIFFIETSCKSHLGDKIVLTARQACAVESAARSNPNYGIYLLVASPGVIRFENTESDKILRAMMQYDNVKIHHLDYVKYTKGTPVENLFRQGKVEQSKFPTSHASDVLRYLTLWKYGGIYLDLDVVITRSLEQMPSNFAGIESDEKVAAGVIGFAPTGPGHDLALRCLEDLKQNFDGQDWTSNGPGVINRLFRNSCGVTLAKDMPHRQCENVKVYPPGAFYPVGWWNWTMYFDEALANNVFDMAKESYAIHVWNKFSAHTKLDVKDSSAAYATFARKYCPKVFNECEDYF